MKLSDYCDALNTDLVLLRYANQQNHWTAQFEHCEIKEGGCLVSAYGYGKTPFDAMRDYATLIEGKRIVFDASGPNRREFVVPELEVMT